MPIEHLVFSSSGRQTIFTGEAEVLAGVRALERGAAGSLVLFCIVDDHVHALVEIDDVGRVAGNVLRSLRTVSAVQLEPAHRQAVTTRAHLEWLANRYLLGQPAKHGLSTPAALWPGSCFLDLVGARRMFAAPLRLGRVLPRYRLRQAFAAVGLPPEPLRAYGDGALRLAGAARIVAAAAAAAGIASARERNKVSTSARRAAGALCASAGVHSTELAFALAMPPASARRLMQSEVDTHLCTAIRLRLALEDVVARSATRDVPSSRKP